VKNSIKANIQDTIRQQRKALKERREELEKLNALPQELINHDWGDLIKPYFYDLIQDYEICLRLQKPSQALVDELKDFLGKTFGFAFERVGHTTGEIFYYTGVIEGVVINGKRIRIQIDNAPKPVGCRLVEKVVTKQVIEYQAYCKETGEEV